MKLILNNSLSLSDWDNFISKNANDGGLLQSSVWEAFQVASNSEVRRCAVFSDSIQVAGFLLIKKNIWGGRYYFYAPRGPVFLNSLSAQERQEIINFILSQVEFSDRKNIFLRLEPAEQDSAIYNQLGFRYGGQLQPKKTLRIDLSIGTKQLLANMKPKTRYNIRLAEKHGIKIEMHDLVDEILFEDFWRLILLTCKRDKIKPHNKDYYRRQLALKNFKLFTAKLNQKTIAVAIWAGFGNSAIYLHGASDYDYRDKMATYLLQWQMISYSLESNYRYYDFWGADLAKWPGVTRFKIGFAPQTKLTEYIGVRELPLSIFYYFYYFLKKII